MSQRNSGYERKPDDLYITPSWVVDALQPHVPGVRSVWEPAAGNMAMANAMSTWYGVTVRATDLNIPPGEDFLMIKHAPYADLIATNPPYKLAQDFIEHALVITRVTHGRVAMLLRADYDSAKTRQHLFGRCPVFAKKIVLTDRIRWFPDSTGAPSFNHCWYLWDHNYNDPGGARLAYHTRETPAK